MRKFHFILLVTLGFLLSPAVSFACGKASGGHPKEVSSKSCGKDCCKKEKQSKSCEKGHEGCQGQCGHSSCNCPSGGFSSLAIITIFHFKPGFAVQPVEKAVFGYTESLFHSAIDSLWLPPKIG